MSPVFIQPTPRCVKRRQTARAFISGEADELARLRCRFCILVPQAVTAQPAKLVLRSSYAPTGGASHILPPSRVKGRIVTSLEQIIADWTAYSSQFVTMSKPLVRLGHYSTQQLSPLVSKI